MGSGLKVRSTNSEHNARMRGRETQEVGGNKRKKVEIGYWPEAEEDRRHD